LESKSLECGLSLGEGRYRGIETEHQSPYPSSPRGNKKFRL